MTNQVHLLLTPPQPQGVPQLIISLGRHYVQYINKTYRSTGTLWAGKTIVMFRPRADSALGKAVQPDPARRYEALSEFLYDRRHPKLRLGDTVRKPLIGRNPVAFWQKLSGILSYPSTFPFTLGSWVLRGF